MAEFTLYCFAQSGNCYKAALALELAGADWAPRFVDYFAGETRTPEYRAVNVMGEALTQSGVFLDYLVDTLGRFGPADASERLDILRWILWDNHKLTSYTATYRFMRCFSNDVDPAVLKVFRARSEAAWGVLDAHLAGRDYVAAERLTIADLSLCGYLFWPEEIGVDWTGYPNIRDWLGRIRAEPRWMHPYRLMPGHPRSQGV